MVITTATIGKDDNENDNYIEEPDISSSMKLIAVHVSITEDFISSFQFELCDNKSLIPADEQVLSPAFRTTAADDARTGTWR